MPRTARPVRIEVVCTGNICRSPYLEAALRDALAVVAPRDFEVTSSGTHALAGQSPEPGTLAMLRRRGLDPDGLRARQLTRAILQDADLVIVMEPSHRRFVAEEDASAASRTFLAPEFARILDELGRSQPWTERLATISAAAVLERWQAVVHAAHLARGRPQPALDIVADPYWGPLSAFERMARHLDASVLPMVAIERSAREDEP